MHTDELCAVLREFGIVVTPEALTLEVWAEQSAIDAAVKALKNATITLDE